MPSKGSLTKARQRISFLFFKDIFQSLIKDFEPFRKTFRGFYIYAVDGDQLQLPCSEDILNNGYLGCPCKDGTETHYLRMYLSHAYDVLSGVTKSIRFSPWLNEIAHAITMIPQFETNSITLYDRLYLSTELIKTHARSKNFFIARCKKGSTFSLITQLFNSKGWYSRMVIEGVEVHLYKHRNHKTGEIYIYATNLPQGAFNREEIAMLYTRRWGVETSFKDSTSTMKMEQWHSESFNGILQELYAHFWLISYTRIQIALKEDSDPEEFLNAEYKKTNFKLILEFIVENIPSLVRKTYRLISREIKFLMKKSMEKRKHHSRSYQRQNKSVKKVYKNASLVPRRAC